MLAHQARNDMYNTQEIETICKTKDNGLVRNQEKGIRSSLEDCEEDSDNSFTLEETKIYKTAEQNIDLPMSM